MHTNYYKINEMMDGENEPIGILLCSEKNEAVVKYTLPGGNKYLHLNIKCIYLKKKN